MLFAPEEVILTVPSIKRVSSHPRRFRRVFIQLLGNAAEAMNIFRYGPTNIKREVGQTGRLP